MIIAVIGGSSCTKRVARMAEAVGRELARRGITLVCGGLGGVMEAACRGAYTQGGLTIGILPSDNRYDANPYVRIPLPTGMGYSRNVLVVKSAEAAIAIDGSYGTLSEIGHALQLKIPVVGLNTWELAHNKKPDTCIIVARDPLDAVEKAVAAAEARHPLTAARRTKRRK